jgi:hypothetical protein
VTAAEAVVQADARVLIYHEATTPVASLRLVQGKR